MIRSRGAPLPDRVDRNRGAMNDPYSWPWLSRSTDGRALAPCQKFTSDAISSASVSSPECIQVEAPVVTTIGDFAPKSATTVRTSIRALSPGIPTTGSWATNSKVARRMVTESRMYAGREPIRLRARKTSD